MNSFKIKSYAKINLALNVTGKAIKLHKIESLVCFIELHDLIYVKQIDKNDLIFSSFWYFLKAIISRSLLSIFKYSVLSIFCFGKLNLGLEYDLTFE